MYRPVDVIEVWIWGERAGAVMLDPARGFHVFEYDPKWLRKGIELAPLTMPLAPGGYTFPDLPQATYKRLPALLADALPDDFGNALVEAYFAREGIHRSAITALDRLAYMGSRSMGALEFKPARSPRKVKPSAIELSSLVISSRQLLSGDFSGDEEAKAAVMNLIQVGTSAGGARAKAVIAWNPETQAIQSGQLPANPGFEHWLIKLDGIGEDKELGASSHYGRIEYAYHLMATHAGIHMAPCRLMEEGGRAHFMTQRFDRVAGQKIHMQTLCAMQHLDYKLRGVHDYSQYFLTIRELGLGDKAMQEGFRRMVFNVLAANCDDHTKNLSFVLPQHGSWDLSPAYDVTHAFNPQGEWTYQHLMSVNGKFRDIQIADLMAVAIRFDIPEARHLIKAVQDALGQWPHFASQAGLPAALVERIQRDFVV